MAKLSRSAEFYKKNPDARAKKADYDKEFNKKPEQRKKRSMLVKARRKRGIYGKGGDDVSHTKNGLVMKPKSANRGSSTDTQGDKRARSKKIKGKRKSNGKGN